MKREKASLPFEVLPSTKFLLKLPTGSYRCSCSCITTLCWSGQVAYSCKSTELTQKENFYYKVFRLSTHFFLEKNNCFTTSLNFLLFLIPATSSKWASFSIAASLSSFSISADIQSPQLRLPKWDNFRFVSLDPHTFESERESFSPLSGVERLRVLIASVLHGELPGVSATPESARLSCEMWDKLFLLPDKGDVSPENTLEFLEQTESREVLLRAVDRFGRGIHTSEELRDVSFAMLGSDNTLSLNLISGSIDVKLGGNPKETGRGLEWKTIAFFLTLLIVGLQGGVLLFFKSIMITFTLAFSSSSFLWHKTVLFSSKQSGMLLFSFDVEALSASPVLSLLDFSSADRLHFFDLRCKFRIKLPETVRNTLWCLWSRTEKEMWLVLRLGISEQLFYNAR